MNRRNFFKAVTGFVAGVFASTAKSKEKPKDLCGGQNGTLCPRCKFNDERSQLGQLPEIDDGLKDAFCYGGKLFRVFRGYMHDDFTMIQLREGKWEKRHLLHNSEWANWKYRHRVCEYMLRCLERMKHPAYTIDESGFVSLLID
jgi:hypothetical protein